MKSYPLKVKTVVKEIKINKRGREKKIEFETKKNSL